MWTQSVLKLLALSLMGGILCGALWDVFKAPRVLLGLCKCKEIRIVNVCAGFVWDVIFCIVCGCVAIVVFYYGNEGVFRGVAVALMAMGFWAYRVSVGAFVVFAASKICLLLKRVSRWFVLKIKEKFKKIKEE